jgi:predicted nucleic acid-binding protein
MKSPKVCEPIRQEHLQITKIALARSLTLVTHYTPEFERVQGLRSENWEVVA